MIVLVLAGIAVTGGAAAAGSGWGIGLGIVATVFGAIAARKAGRS
jgi:hypothetical protein